MVSFRKRIRVGDNTYFNLSKSGVSLSSGVKGVRYTLSRRGIDRTFSLPGTGIYSRRRVIKTSRASQSTQHGDSKNRPENTTTINLKKIDKALEKQTERLNRYTESQLLKIAIKRANRSFRISNRILIAIFVLLIIGIFLPPLLVVEIALLPLYVHFYCKSSKEIKAQLSIATQEQSESVYFHVIEGTWSHPLSDIAEYVVLNGKVDLDDIAEAYKLSEQTLGLVVSILERKKIVEFTCNGYAVIASVDQMRKTMGWEPVVGDIAEGGID